MEEEKKKFLLSRIKREESMIVAEFQKFRKIYLGKEISQEKTEPFIEHITHTMQINSSLAANLYEYLDKPQMEALFTRAALIFADLTDKYRLTHNHLTFLASTQNTTQIRAICDICHDKIETNRIENIRRGLDQQSQCRAAIIKKLIEESELERTTPVFTEDEDRLFKKELQKVFANKELVLQTNIRESNIFLTTIQEEMAEFMVEFRRDFAEWGGTQLEEENENWGKLMKSYINKKLSNSFNTKIPSWIKKMHDLFVGHQPAKVKHYFMNKECQVNITSQSEEKLQKELQEMSHNFILKREALKDREAELEQEKIRYKALKSEMETVQQFYIAKLITKGEKQKTITQQQIIKQLRQSAANDIKQPSADLNYSQAYTELREPTAETRQNMAKSKKKFAKMNEALKKSNKDLSAPLSNQIDRMLEQEDQGSPVLRKNPSDLLSPHTESFTTSVHQLKLIGSYQMKSSDIYQANPKGRYQMKQIGIQQSRAIEKVKSVVTQKIKKSAAQMSKMSTNQKIKSQKRKQNNTKQLILKGSYQFEQNAVKEITSRGLQDYKQSGAVQPKVKDSRQLKQRGLHQQKSSGGQQMKLKKKVYTRDKWEEIASEQISEANYSIINKADTQRQQLRKEVNAISKELYHSKHNTISFDCIQDSHLVKSQLTPIQQNRIYDDSEFNSAVTKLIQASDHQKFLTQHHRKKLNKLIHHFFTSISAKHNKNLNYNKQIQPSKSNVILNKQNLYSQYRQAQSMANKNLKRQKYKSMESVQRKNSSQANVLKLPAISIRHYNYHEERNQQHLSKQYLSLFIDQASAKKFQQLFVQNEDHNICRPTPTQLQEIEKMYSLIELLKRRGSTLYIELSTFLRYPYSSLKGNEVSLSHSSINFSIFSNYFLKILWLHRNCLMEEGSSFCGHIQKFKRKIGEVMSQGKDTKNYQKIKRSERNVSIK